MRRTLFLVLVLTVAHCGFRLEAAEATASHRVIIRFNYSVNIDDQSLPSSNDHRVGIAAAVNNWQVTVRGVGTGDLGCVSYSVDGGELKTLTTEPILVGVGTATLSPPWGKWFSLEFSQNEDCTPFQEAEYEVSEIGEQRFGVSNDSVTIPINFD